MILTATHARKCSIADASSRDLSEASIDQDVEGTTGTTGADAQKVVERSHVAAIYTVLDVFLTSLCGSLSRPNYMEYGLDATIFLRPFKKKSL